ncbi:MAG: preprotein translocase subunit SecG [Syntrophales bacterium]
MQILITILHIAVCVILILVVLLQAGKGANMGAVFGGSSQTIFGSSGPGTFLGKMTSIVAAVFMITSLALSYSATHKASSVMEKAASQAQQQTMPAPAEKAPLSTEQNAPAGQQK